MEKRTIFVISAIIILIIALLFIFGNWQTNQEMTTNEDIQQQKQIQTANENNQPEGNSGEIKEFSIIAKKWEFQPGTITVNKGDSVRLIIESVDVTHGISIPAFNINENLTPGKKTTIEFTADKKGNFQFFCSVFCGQGHGNMQGTLVVE